MRHGEERRTMLPMPHGTSHDAQCLRLSRDHTRIRAGPRRPCCCRIPRENAESNPFRSAGISTHAPGCRCFIKSRFPLAPEKFYVFICIAAILGFAGTTIALDQLSVLLRACRHLIRGFAVPTIKPIIGKWLAIASLLMLALGVAGCAPLIVGSIAGSLDLAAYEYAQAQPQKRETSQGQSTAQQPKPSINDIE